MPIIAKTVAIHAKKRDNRNVRQVAVKRDQREWNNRRNDHRAEFRGNGNGLSLTNTITVKLFTGNSVREPAGSLFCACYACLNCRAHMFGVKYAFICLLFRSLNTEIP